ncbi:MAG TPA: hypothetical protein VN540_00545 [Clostridia bacterium]|nr:hypothetical protein [Clostridia bacterium]
MKKTLAMLLAVLVLFALTACKSGNVASPSPKITVKPTMTAGAATNAPASPSPSAPASSASPGTTGGGETIEGFKEGETVQVNALPSKVTSAVSEKYPGATITAASYATYMNAQTYLLTLSGAADKTDKIYVKPDGSIIPYATPTAT